MKSVLLITILLITCSVFGIIEVTEIDSYGFSADIECDYPRITESNYGDFVDIEIAKGALDGGFGEPFMPAFRYLVELPIEGNAEVSISSHSSRYIDISAPPSPLQPPRRKNQSPPDFAFDRASYNNPPNRPIAEIKRFGIMRGRAIGILVVRPLSYDATTSRLEFRNNIDVRVSFDKPVSRRPARLASEWVDGMLESSIITPMDVPRVFDLPPHYLILTDDYFSSNLSEFVQFKEQQGYNVTVASVDTIGADTLSIKDFVSNAYHTWPIPPDYLLIVGDVDRVPTLRKSIGWDNYPTDQYFVMVDGSDYLPDIACGRMSVESLDELDAIVGKTIAYAKFDFDETDWLRHFILPACGTDGDYELCMGTQRYVASTHLPPSDYDVDTIFAYFGGTGAEVISALNEGAAVTDYSGHGLEDGWSNPTVGNSDVYALTNYGEFGLVISNACLTNRFDHDFPCFGEVWIRQENKGAVAHIAGSASTYWEEDDWWERTVFDMVFDNGYFAAASFMYRGCLEVEIRGSSAAEYYFNIYHTLGDPSLSFYWGEPEEITVHLPSIIPIGLSALNIDVPESTIVSVWAPSGTRGVAYSIGGSANVTLDPEPTAGDTLTVYCWRPNFYEPVWARIPVASLVAYTVNPDSLIVSVPDTISIYMGDTLGTPTPGATAVIEGIALIETLVTDSYGSARLPITPIYAETLQITGYNPIGELAFVEYLPVGGGSPILPIGIELASPLVRIYDSLATGVTGQIGFESPEYPCLWCLQGLGFDTCATVSDSAVIEVSPMEAGEIDLITAVEGYALGYSTIRAADCFAHFDGTVGGASGPPAEDIRLILYPAGSDTATTEYTATCISNAFGVFETEDEIKLGYYDAYISGFGWEDTVITDHIHHADGGYDFELQRSNLCSLSVISTDDLGSPILSEIYVIRDNNVLVGYSRTGELYLDSLPRYNYEVNVSAREKSIFKSTIYLESDTTVTASLQPARANVLLISIEDDLAADYIETNLGDFSLTVVRKDFMPAVDTTFHYEFVIYSAGGGSDGDVCSELTGHKLLEYRYAGIKLLIEGGEFAYSYYNAENEEVLDSLLMMSNWNGDDPGTSNLVLNDEPEHAIELAYNPATLPGLVTPRDVGHWDFEYFDLVTPSISDLLYSIGSTPQAGVSYYADVDCRGLHRIAHMFFKYDDALTTPYANEKILKNAVEWLRPPDFEHGVLLARAWVPGGESGDIGVNGGGDTTVTSADGRFRLQTPPGTHSLSFSATHIVDTVVTGIELGPGEIRSGDVYVLVATGIDELPKPDEYALTGLYPNPFNGRIAFEIQVPSAAEISLSIYDINGRRIHQFKDDFPGNRILVWDTSEDRELPSGVYFYKIEFPDREVSGKILLVK